MPLEGNHIDFRAEAFNALNHPQFGAPQMLRRALVSGER
jgi:hypothetical protein